MSEYQYYEFLALDRALEPSEISALRGISSRAEISATQFSNVYNYGDFRGSPEKLMEQYFDAHVYVANWGTHTLMLRLPRDSVDKALLTRYRMEDCLRFWTTKDHLIIQWQRNSEEPPDDWVDGHGWMARLLGIREELERGDYRALYLGWLYGVQSHLPTEVGDSDEEFEFGSAVTLETIEPTVPPGLRSPTAAQRALAEFLGIDQDFIAAAAKTSTDTSVAADLTQAMEHWVTHLSVDEARPYLLLLVQGKARQAEAQIRHAYMASNRTSGFDLTNRTAEHRSVADLRAVISEARAERLVRETEQKQREIEKKRLVREGYLTKVAKDAERHWKQVADLAEQRNGPAYDKVRDLLIDLSEAATLVKTRDDFTKRFNQFFASYGRSSALRKRLEKANLLSKD